MKQEIIDTPNYKSKSKKRKTHISATCPKCEHKGISLAVPGALCIWKCPYCGYEC